MPVVDRRAAAPAPPRTEQIRRHQWLATLGQAVRTPRGAIGLGLVCVVAAIAAIGPFVAPHPSDLPPPLTFGMPSPPFPLRRPLLARHVLSRALDGVSLPLL